jgi:ribosomal protein L37AE/L43A
MTTKTNEDITRIDGPVAIHPHALCHNCNTFMDGELDGIWECPSCGIKANVQCNAEVVDNES